MTVHEARKLAALMVAYTYSDADEDMLLDRLRIEFPWFDWRMIWRDALQKETT